MRLPDPPPRHGPEPLLPMIDVVFFLVVFFMIVSRFTTAEPFAVDRPVSAEADLGEGAFSLFLSPAGEAGFVGETAIVTGEAALVALAGARAAYCAAGCGDTPPVLLLYTDAAMPGAMLAGILSRLGAMGFSDLRLLTVAR